MQTKRRVESTGAWAGKIGYSRAVRVGNQIFVAGTTAPGNDAYTQAKGAFSVISDALRELGASAGHVVATRIYLTNIDRDWEAVGKAHLEDLGEAMPVATMVEVARLARPDLLVEIEVQAVAD